MRRPRRNRRSAAIRGMVQEHRLSVDQLVYPLFLVEGKGIKEEVSSLPGNHRHSTDEALRTIAECLELGLKNFILFPALAE